MRAQTLTEFEKQSLQNQRLGLIITLISIAVSAVVTITVANMNKPIIEIHNYHYSPEVKILEKSWG